MIQSSSLITGLPLTSRTGEWQAYCVVDYSNLIVASERISPTHTNTTTPTLELISPPKFALLSPTVLPFLKRPGPKNVDPSRPKKTEL